MEIVEVFSENGINIICFNRDLTWAERAKKTAKIGDKIYSVNSTTNSRWMSTKDVINDPGALKGHEIELK